MRLGPPAREGLLRLDGMTAKAAELLDLADPAVVADPYPAFAALRAEAPVAWHDELHLWVATSHAACSQVLRERSLGRIFRPRQPEEEWDTFNWLHADSILDSEPPKHTRLRRLVQSAFSRGHVSRLGPRIEELTAGLLDDCADHLRADGSFDVIADLAEPLPVLVIAELLGWPEADRHLLRPWSQAIVKMYEVNRTPDQEADAVAASAQFAEYVETLADNGFRARPTTCCPTSTPSATAATGCPPASWWPRPSCCSTPGTRRA